MKRMQSMTTKTFAAAALLSCGELVPEGGERRIDAGEATAVVTIDLTEPLRCTVLGASSEHGDDAPGARWVHDDPEASAAL